MNCIFCAIVDKKIPSNKVHENDEFLAFHDIHPKAPVHILVIPKAHYATLQETPSEIMCSLTEFVKETAIKLGLDKSGYRFIINNGSDGGQEVYHLHVHILGGTKLKWIDLTEDADEARKSL